MPETFSVLASGELLGSLVVSMLRTILPRRVTTEVTLSVGSPAYEGAVIRNTGTGRWGYLSANATPDASMAEALKDGASAVMSLNSSRADFESAIKALGQDGVTFVPSDLVDWLVSQSRQQSNGKRPPAGQIQLTGREHEVLRLVLEGQTNNEIAETLTISPNTVRSHIHSLSLKFEASNRARLVNRARMLGFDTASHARLLQPVRDVSA